MNYACGEAGIANGLVQLGHMDFNKNFTETCSFFLHPYLLVCILAGEDAYGH